MTSLLDEALKYAEHGYYVFPCREKNYGKKFNNKTNLWDDLFAKRPFTTHGFKDGSMDESQIKEWWRIHPNAAIGADCGRSNIFVVDIDTHHEGISGFDAWHKLGISDEGCNKVMTPSGKGMHIYFSDPNSIGRTQSKKKTGLDYRGKGGYVILPHSEIQFEDGTKKKYIALTDMFSTPKEVTVEMLEKFGLVRKEKINRGVYINNMPLSDELQKAKNLLWKLPFDVVNDYDQWLRVGMYLRKFGEQGRDVWFSWTEEKYFSVKPNSKRKNIEYKWLSIQDEREQVTIGTLYHYAKEAGLNFR